MCSKVYGCLPKYGLSPAACAVVEVLATANPQCDEWLAGKQRYSVARQFMLTICDPSNALLRWSSGSMQQPKEHHDSDLDGVFMLLGNTVHGHDQHPLEQALWATTHRAKLGCGDCQVAASQWQQDRVAVHFLCWDGIAADFLARSMASNHANTIDVVQVAQAQLELGHTGAPNLRNQHVGWACPYCPSGRISIQARDVLPGALLTFRCNLEGLAQSCPGRLSGVGSRCVTLSVIEPCGNQAQTWHYSLAALLYKGTWPGSPGRVDHWITLVDGDRLCAAGMHAAPQGTGSIQNLPSRLVELWRQGKGHNVRELCRGWHPGEESRSNLNTLPMATQHRLVATTCVAAPDSWAWVVDLETGVGGHVQTNMMQASPWCDAFNPYHFSHRLNEVWMVFTLCSVDGLDPQVKAAEDNQDKLVQQLAPIREPNLPTDQLCPLTNKREPTPITIVPNTGLLPGQVSKFANMGNYKLPSSWDDAIKFDGVVPDTKAITTLGGGKLVIRLKRSQLEANLMTDDQPNKHWMNRLSNGHVYKAARGNGYDPKRTWRSSSWKDTNGNKSRCLEQRCVGSLMCLTANCPRQKAMVEDHVQCFELINGQWRCIACNKGHLDKKNSQSGASMGAMAMAETTAMAMAVLRWG
jgi:hypothetical protein